MGEVIGYKGTKAYRTDKWDSLLILRSYLKRYEQKPSLGNSDLDKAIYKSLFKEYIS